MLEDSTGAVIGLWEAVEREGAQLVNAPSAWAMSVLHTDRTQDAADFYREVFGWESESFAPGVALFRLPGYVGGQPAQPVPRDVVAVMAEDDVVPGYWSVGFWVADADALAGRTRELAGRVLAPPSDAAGMRQAVLADPAGATFSVTTAPAGG